MAIIILCTSILRAVLQRKQTREPKEAKRQAHGANPTRKETLYLEEMNSPPRSTRPWRNIKMSSSPSFSTLPAQSPPLYQAPPTQTTSSHVISWTDAMLSWPWLGRGTGSFPRWGEPSIPPWLCCMSFTPRAEIGSCITATIVGWLWRHATTVGSVM